jgi:hypothetical protein
VPFENTYRELLTHVLFHSSIHRGNIVLKMREEGLERQDRLHLYLRRKNFLPANYAATRELETKYANSFSVIARAILLAFRVFAGNNFGCGRRGIRGNHV